MMQDETAQAFEQEKKMYPIQLVQVENLHEIAAPLARISTCGGLSIEVLEEVISLDPPQGRYVLLTLKHLRKQHKGYRTGMGLLKVLSSQPGYFGTKDWIIESLLKRRKSRGTDEDELDGWDGMVRLDNIVSLLRSLLCPAGIAGEAIVRKRLVEYVGATPQSGAGYRLACWPLLWLDVESLEEQIQQACLREQMGEDALPCWEQVYALASKGSYLPDELYSDWAIDKRVQVEGYLRQSIHALHRLSLARHGQAAEERVLLLLRTYWQSHPTDEDLLRPLMELLGKRDRVQEAKECYQRLCQRLAAQGETPDARTQKTVQDLRAGRSQRKQEAANTREVDAFLTASSFPLPNPQDLLAPFSHAVTQGIMEAVRELEGALPVNLSEPIDRRIVLARLLEISPTLLALDWHTSSSFADAVSVLKEDPPAFIDEKTLMTFEKVTENSWLLLRYDGLLTVEQLLPIYLQRFALFAQKPSRYQERAAGIVAQGYMLQGLVAVLNSDSAGSEKFCEQAVFYARLAKDRHLEAAALKHLATKFLDNGHPLWTLQKFQEVLPFVKDISPLLRGRTYLGLALAYARIHQESEALYYLDLAHDSFPENPESDVSFSYADCHTSSLYHYGGLIHTEFARFEKARDMFVQVEELPTKSTIPERTRIEIMNCQAEASLALRDVRSSCDLIEKSITGALKLKSDKRYHDALTLYKQARLLWPQERQVKDLADLFIR